MAKGLGIVAVAVAIAFTGFVHTKIEPRTHVDRGEAFVPDPQAAQIAALGFDAVAADYYWLQAIQAVGGHVIVDEGVGRHLGLLIDVVTTLDPWVDHPYRFAAIWMTEGEDNVRKANELLERGIAHHPDDWRNWFYLGFNHFYYLGEDEIAADALETASMLPGSPPYLPRLVARLRSAHADIDVALVFLHQMLESTDDPERRAVYQAALDEIEVETKARFLDKAREAHIKLLGRDIERVEDLVSGPNPMLEKLPAPVPDALPSALARGSTWEIGEDGRIVSTYYGSRYEVHYSPNGASVKIRSDEGEATGEQLQPAENGGEAEAGESGVGREGEDEHV
jgi:hypothetical protein